MRAADGASCLTSMTGAFAQSDFLSCTEIDSFNSKAVDPNIGTLSCSFGPGELCRFYNVATDQLAWRHGQFLANGAVFENKFAALTGRRRGLVPNDGFVFVGEPFPREQSDSAILRADFDCQRGVGHVTFDFWRSAENLKLQVCTNSMTSSIASRFCTNPVDYDLSVPITLPVEPPSQGPFYIELVVTGMTSPSVIILDNLNYTADFCNSKLITANNVEQAPAISKISVIKMSDAFLDACSALLCDFSDTICNYITAREGDNTSSDQQWHLAGGKIGNPHTGIRRIDSGDQTALKPGFAFVGGDMGNANFTVHTLFVLESANFKLEKDILLSFDLYQRSFDVKFKVCLNNISNCPYSNPPLDKENYWYEGETVVMPRNTEKVFFVATKMKRNTWLAIDNIVVNQGLGCKPLQPILSPFLIVSSV